MNPCLDCPKYTYYGCSNGKVCDKRKEWSKKSVRARAET